MNVTLIDIHPLHRRSDFNISGPLIVIVRDYDTHARPRQTIIETTTRMSLCASQTTNVNREKKKNTFLSHHFSVHHLSVPSIISGMGESERKRGNGDRTTTDIQLNRRRTQLPMNAPITWNTKMLKCKCKAHNMSNLLVFARRKINQNQ